MRLTGLAFELTALEIRHGMGTCLLVLVELLQDTLGFRPCPRTRAYDRSWVCGNRVRSAGTRTDESNSNDEVVAHPVHSLGANRLTPACTAASIRNFCATLPGSECATINESTVSTPCKILASWAGSW